VADDICNVCERNSSVGNLAPELSITNIIFVTTSAADTTICVSCPLVIKTIETIKTIKTIETIETIETSLLTVLG